MLSGYAAQQTLERVFRGGAYAPPTTKHAGIYLGSAEFTGTGYTRTGIGSAGFAPATVARPSVVTKAGNIALGVAASGWPTSYDGFRLHDAAAAGNELFRQSFTARTVASGDTIQMLGGAGTYWRLGVGAGAANWEASYLATIQDWWFREGAAPAQITQWALFNDATELSGTGYARSPLVSGDWVPATAASDTDPSVVTNANVLTFTASAGGAWGTYNRAVFFAGTTRVVELTFTARTISAGDSVTFGIGAASFSLT